MYNLIQYSDNYSKTWRGLWQCYRDEPSLNNVGPITDSDHNTNSVSFKFTQQMIGQTG